MRNQKTSSLTHAYLLQILHYNPEIGIFTWIENYWRRLVGTRAGGETVQGYRKIHIGDEYHYEAPLAWFYMTGSWPEAEIDHINLRKDDNRWCNLRAATRAQNAANVEKQKTCSSRFKGVTFVKGTKPWKGYIEVKGKAILLGYFHNEYEAAKAYDRAAKKYFGEYARLNFNPSERDWLIL